MIWNRVYNKIVGAGIDCPNNMKLDKKERKFKRQCLVCRIKKDKSELLRVVKTPLGEILLDETGKKDGRGAYLCKIGECKAKCIKTRGLNRAYKCNVDNAVYEALKS